AGTALEFKNPKDAKTTLADVNNGELVTVRGIYSSSFKNVSAILESHEAATTTYTASVKAGVTGVTLSKTTGLAFGEEVTVSIEVPEGKVVDSVTVNHGYGSETVEAVEGVYKFNAHVVNEVEVVFGEAAAPTGTVSYDIAGNLDKFVDTDGVALGTNYAAASAKISGVTFTGTLVSVPGTKAGNWEDNGLAMRAKIKNEDASESAKQYLTIESAHAFTGASIVMQGWTTDRSETTLEYSTDGVNWTKDSCAAVTLDGSAADATTHTLTIADTISVKYVRLASWGKGAGKSYQSRIGIFSATLTYPEA
ncbi:MAG: hypothetical protein II520_02950, partial [Bacilli bacterium]|nr:hypothetical protein [Bacilli bacterium]